MFSKRRFAFLLALAFLWPGASVTRAGAPALAADAEAASHGGEAASVQLVAETAERTPDFAFRQYNLGVLSHYSYMIASGGEALVIDPARDVDRYLKDAAELGAKIRYVYLTHSHADFVAGHIELRAAAGAEIVMNEATGALFEHRKVRDGDEIRFGKVRAVVVVTPGHTPDGTCLYVHHPAESPHPQRVLTGDTLFIGSVGRPDLLPADWAAATLARMGFESWTGKLSKLPDGTKIFPAHGAGSLCGAHLSDKPVATIGEERASNPYLKHKDVASYVMAVLDGLPEAPQYFKHNAKLNHDGPPPLKRDVLPPTLEPAAAAEQSAKGAWLVDVRDAAEFSRLHPRGAINIGIRGRFETWTGTMIPWGAPFILLGAAPEVREAASRLHRIGYDSPAGSIGGGLEAWVKAGLPTQSVALVKPVDLHGQMKQGKAPIVLDVRLPAEWMALRIGQALNIPITKLSDAGAKLDRKMPILAVCNSAYRSSMAAGVLQKLGFQDLRNLEGGSEAWITAGLPTLGPGAQAGHAPAAAVPAGVHVNLPDPISPEDLARRLLDLPGTIEVIDLRPAPQFAEFNLPGSTNAPIEQALAGEAYLADKRPLVIVCRDGYLSASVAGALVQKLTRPVRYLVGGVSRYYDEILRPKGITSAPTLLPPPGSPGAAPAAQPVPGVKPAPAPAAPAPAPAAPRKRSAGC